ncbi:hypothetical protein L2E82_05758 [Cichorium intybus]|uniref:Uncharacterized protein n=1 Tax=Cichorium intybus TaxID=13427 RepID=A0ACB9H8X8_CICIN|nr:hypothetical protein L2E82_05758 [Cichorium intybus]
MQPSPISASLPTVDSNPPLWPLPSGDGGGCLAPLSSFHTCTISSTAFRQRSNTDFSIAFHQGSNNTYL